MNNNCKSVLLNTTSASEFILQLTGKSSSAILDLFHVTLLAKEKKGIRDKIAQQRMSRTEQNNARCTYNIFQLVRDSIFLVEIASALSSSTNIWFLLQSGGCVATWSDESLQPGHATYGFSFPHLGARQKWTLSLIATKTPLLKCRVDKHKPNVMKLAQYLLQERWLLAQL